VSSTDSIVAFIRACLDDDERWARAANQVYRYAEGNPSPPETGVHWTWVKGENWTPTTPDPVTEEFVGDGTGEWNVNLATVEQWPSRVTPSSPDPLMPRTYAGTIEELDPSAAGHIVRWDPARVLAEVEAKRKRIAWLLEREHDMGDEDFPTFSSCRILNEPGSLGDLAVGYCSCGLDSWRNQLFRFEAQPFAGRDGWREEWAL
jgi:hypothetical protein